MSQVRSYQKKIETLVAWITASYQPACDGLATVLEECGDIEHDSRAFKDRVPVSVAGTLRMGGVPLPTWRTVVQRLRAEVAALATPPVAATTPGATPQPRAEQQAPGPAQAEPVMSADEAEAR